MTRFQALMAKREKVPTLIISFKTTTNAIAAEKFVLENELPGRIIPLPREVSSGCGLSWKAKPEEEEMLVAALNDNNLAYAGTHIVTI